MWMLLAHQSNTDLIKILGCCNPTWYLLILLWISQTFCFTQFLNCWLSVEEKKSHIGFKVSASWFSCRKLIIQPVFSHSSLIHSTVANRCCLMRLLFLLDELSRAYSWISPPLTQLVSLPRILFPGCRGPLLRQHLARTFSLSSSVGVLLCREELWQDRDINNLKRPRLVVSHRPSVSLSP